MRVVHKKREERGKGEKEPGKRKEKRRKKGETEQQVRDGTTGEKEGENR